MTLSRRRFNQLVLGAITVSSMPSAFAKQLEEGREWRAIQPPQPSDTPGKIEVLEFFSYGCPHCNDLNPLVKSWGAKLGEDVVFRRIPVTFGRQTWANLARMYYALESMGSLERLDQEIFNALLQKRVKLYTEPAIIDWLKGKEIDTETFAQAYNSFDVQTKVGRSDYLVKKYAINAVPTITVGGRYAVLGRGAKDLSELLSIADGLIDKARADGAQA